MVARTKISMNDRARIFLPFDTLKGLHEALRAKEYEMEMIEKGKISPEQAEVISKRLSNLEKEQLYEATFYENGHYLKCKGKATLRQEDQTLIIGDKQISLKDLFGLIEASE